MAFLDASVIPAGKARRRPELTWKWDFTSNKKYGGSGT
jgi:hypothetical protein